MIIGEPISHIQGIHYLLREDSSQIIALCALSCDRGVLSVISMLGPISESEIPM